MFSYVQYAVGNDHQSASRWPWPHAPCWMQQQRCSDLPLFWQCHTHSWVAVAIAVLGHYHDHDHRGDRGKKNLQYFNVPIFMFDTSGPSTTTLRITLFDGSNIQRRFDLDTNMQVDSHSLTQLVYYCASFFHSSPLYFSIFSGVNNTLIGNAPQNICTPVCSQPISECPLWVSLYTEHHGAVTPAGALWW